MFQIKFAGLTIDDIAEWGEDQPSRVGVETFPRRHGSITQKLAFLGPRTITVSGKVFKDSEAELKSYLNTLSATMSDRGRDKLYLRDDNRYLNAIKTGFGYRFGASRQETVSAAFNIEFLADDPFWYDGQTQSNLESAVASSPHSFTVNNGGGTRTPPLIEVKAVGGDRTDFTITNTTIGLSMRFAGTIFSGNTCSIDCADYTVINGGSNGLRDFTGNFWQLEQGDNHITYAGPVTVDVNVVWLERFL